MKKSILLITIMFVGQVHCQNIFEERFKDCNHEYFATEAETISVKLVSDFVQILSSSFDSETVKKIRGVLSLQILVDMNGNSCLMSVKNESNIDTSILSLKAIIDDKLKWQKPKEVVSVIVATKFLGNEVQVKRLGFSKEKGFHELSN